MKRNWYKYRNKNTTCCDCQLVSAVNAYYYLTGKVISDKYYEKLIDLSKCRHGSAIDIHKVWKRLGIGIKKEFRKYGMEKMYLPAETRIWHPHYGFHSVLIVQYEVITNSYRVTNFRYETTTDGWIYKEDFDKYLKPECIWMNVNKENWKKEKSEFKQFGLIKKGRNK